jgi:DNA-binding CsgD family transcriptional regulator
MDSTRLFGAGRGSTHVIEPEYSRRDTGVASNLTAFERRTLGLFAAGVPRGEIAQLLQRAPKTISNSLTAARDKLGARSLAEAAALMAAAEVVSQALSVT